MQTNCPILILNNYDSANKLDWSPVDCFTLSVRKVKMKKQEL